MHHAITQVLTNYVPALIHRILASSDPWSDDYRLFNVSNAQTLRYLVIRTDYWAWMGYGCGRERGTIVSVRLRWQGRYYIVLFRTAFPRPTRAPL